MSRYGDGRKIEIYKELGLVKCLNDVALAGRNEEQIIILIFHCCQETALPL
ncbi:hypothetical protein Plhal304r1_c012g0046181 [Plasmopara halstedii]